MASCGPLSRLRRIPKRRYRIDMLARPETFNRREGEFVMVGGLAAEGVGLASKRPFDHFWPMATPLNFKRRCNPSTVVDVV